MPHEYTFLPTPGDTISCPKCRAVGGQGGEIRVRGIMTDAQYNDRRCSSCGHKWTVGESLELPFEPAQATAAPAKAESGTQVPVEPDSPYDFGDGWTPEPGEESTPF